jgi:hypothetical protein
MAILTCPGDGLQLLRVYGYFNLSGSMAVIDLLEFLAVRDLSAFLVTLGLLGADEGDKPD